MMNCKIKIKQSVVNIHQSLLTEFWFSFELLSLPWLCIHTLSIAIEDYYISAVLIFRNMTPK